MGAAAVLPTSKKRVYTPEEVELLADPVRWELAADGTLVERHMGFESQSIAFKVGYLLLGHVEPRRLGFVSGETGMPIMPDKPRRMPRADVIYVAAERLGGTRPIGLLYTAPDLAVEVVSPRDVAHELDAKVEEYLDAGVRLVWVIYPATRHIQVFGQGGLSRSLHDGDTLTGEDVLPGFAVPVSLIFKWVNPIS